jgi:hypothetical protein
MDTETLSRWQGKFIFIEAALKEFDGTSTNITLMKEYKTTSNKGTCNIPLRLL